MGYETIGAMFKGQVARYGDRLLMKWREGETWKELTWNQFYDNARKLGLALITMGIDPSDRVAIFSANSPRWQMVDVGALSIGAADVPLYATITAKQAEYIIKDSGSKVIFVGTADHLARVLEVKDNLPELGKIVTMDDTTSDHPDVITFGDVLGLGEKNANPDEFDERLAEVGPEDLSSIVYTSGTTGDPKGVMLPHRCFMSNVSTVSKVVHINDTDKVLSFLPLSHVLERMSGYYGSIYNGCTIAHAGSIDTLVDDIAVIKPEWMVSVPRLYEKIHAGVLANVEAEPPLKQKIFNWAAGVGGRVSKLKMNHQPIPVWLGLEYKVADKLVFSKIYEKMGGRLRFFVSGGAPLAREIAEFFHAMGILILEGYGLTETSPVVTCNTPENYRFGSVGLVIPGDEVEIAGDGEILVKGPNVMKGYYNMPEATAEALAGGWFHTGDIGHFDDDGFLYITDRKKDLIVTSGGKNVAPQNIENALKLDRYIEMAAVIGDKRKFVSALIVPSYPDLEAWAKENGVDTSDRATMLADPKVNSFMKERIDAALADFDRHERVTRFTLLPEEMTEEGGLLTPTLKIKRKEVLKQYGDTIEAMYD
ncbi:MAG: long-chain fatty acid--CoA ligase [Actinomycetota bacterium]